MATVIAAGISGVVVIGLAIWGRWFDRQNAFEAERRRDRGEIYTQYLEALGAYAHTQTPETTLAITQARYLIALHGSKEVVRQLAFYEAETINSGHAEKTRAIVDIAQEMRDDIEAGGGVEARELGRAMYGPNGNEYFPTLRPERKPRKSR